MFIRNENNRGISLTKSQKKVVNEALSDVLKRCECSGDLLKSIDALFEIYKETQDGNQGNRLRDDEEAEARANNYGVLVLGKQKTEKCYIYSRYEYAQKKYDSLVTACVNDENIIAIKIVIYDADGTVKDVIIECDHNR